jgi:DNA-binding Lrp family transcriptional regulator
METQDEWRSGEALMTRPKDDWEKIPRKGSAHFTEAEIETMKAGYRNSRPARDVARELKCSSRSVIERYRAWRQAGMKKRETRTIDRAARFYTSTFAVEGRLADCLENAVIYVDEYQLSTSDRARLVRALRVVATMREAISAD